MIDGFFDTPALHLLAIESDSALVVPMDRDAYHRSIFLDRRAAVPESAIRRVSLEPLLAGAAGIESPPVGWIFHIAHCGSTLLARLLDNPHANLVLREPPPLRQMGITFASERLTANWSRSVRLAHAAAARRFERNIPTIVKANVPVNLIQSPLHDLQPDANSILLYLPLRPWLLAVLRTPEHRTWIERLTTAFGRKMRLMTGMRPQATIPERAAALWLMQINIFREKILVQEQNGMGGQAVSLDAQTLFADPIATAERAAQHLGIADLETSQLMSIAAMNAKKPTSPFSNADRQAREKADGIRLEREIDEARRWIEMASMAAWLPEKLTRPLLGEAPKLLT